jgi:hypothetical protein
VTEALPPPLPRVLIEPTVRAALAEEMAGPATSRPTR